jgi:hypothetical protein
MIGAAEDALEATRTRKGRIQIRMADGTKASIRAQLEVEIQQQKCNMLAVKSVSVELVQVEVIPVGQLTVDERE